ncbi:MAG TPA: MlaD family protein [Solirubrobacterales bacterium]|nr:MlaD family protein [Solirubrobacterales bacterium]
MSAKPKAPGRLSRTVRGAVRRSEGRELLLGIVVAIVGGIMALVSWQSVNGVPFQDRYEVKVEIPADAPILKDGDAVRIAGRLAGFVTEVEPHESNVLATLELRPDFAPLGRDARANVKVRSIVYLTYLELFPGNVDDPMPEGGTIPLARSGSGVDLLEVAQVFDAKARAALQDATTSGGVGLAGRGEDVNVALADLRAALPELGSQLEAVVSEPGALARTVAGAARMTRGLAAAGPDELARGIVAGSGVVGAVARQAEALGESLDLLRPFEDELLATAPVADPLLDDANAAARELVPAARTLADALPDVNEVLALGEEIRTETIRLTDAINPILAAAAPVLGDLRATVASIKPLLGPLNKLVNYVAPYADDIRRAGIGIVSATSKKIPIGQSAAGAVALRFAPVLTCHRARDPYPDPGETMEHSQEC